MISINEIRSTSYALAAKQQSGFPSVDEWNKYANLANIDRFNYWNDVRRKSLLKVRTGITITVPQALNPFMVYDEMPTITGGVTTLTNTQSDLLSVASGATKTNVKIVDYDRRNNLLNSSIDAPTTANPAIMLIPNNQIQVYPVSATQLYFTYLKYPTQVKWNYTLTNGRPVFNPTGTVDFQWDETERIPLLMSILKYMGISIDDNALVQTSEQQLQTAN